MRSFDTLAIDPEACIASARRFDADQFRAGLLAQIDLAQAEVSAGRERPVAAARRRRARILAA